jgi:hypothetical protein
MKQTENYDGGKSNHSGRSLVIAISVDAIYFQAGFSGLSPFAAPVVGARYRVPVQSSWRSFRCWHCLFGKQELYLET